jgi:hypothetical protein
MSQQTLQKSSTTWSSTTSAQGSRARGAGNTTTCAQLCILQHTTLCRQALKATPTHLHPLLTQPQVPWLLALLLLLLALRALVLQAQVGRAQRVRHLAQELMGQSLLQGRPQSLVLLPVLQRDQTRQRLQQVEAGMLLMPLG